MNLRPVHEYIAEYWPRLVRHNQEDQGTLVGLPYPYLVPSHETMFQEMYYWDSYFMAFGLIDTEHEQLIIDMVMNMAHLFRRFDVIPNASRYFFTSRSQPPFFTRLILLAYDVKKRRADPDANRFLAEMTSVAQQEHATVWLGTAQPHDRRTPEGLSRYFDANYLHQLAACESGWDHSVRCDDRWLDHLPVDLNAILYAREMDFAEIAELLHEPEEAARWRGTAQARALTMRELMWNEELGFYLDYDRTRERPSPTVSLAGFYPLWAGLADANEAARMVEMWLPRFEQPGGLVTTLVAQSGRQWASPNGWAPLQWLATAGLERYGYAAEAQRIREKWLLTCARVFAAPDSQCLWEKYNVVEVGAPPAPGYYDKVLAGSPEPYGSVPGFGWSNGVFVDFERRLRS